MTVPYNLPEIGAFPISRLFVGRGLDPSLLFCDYRQFPRRGGVTPPYTAISSQSPLPHPYRINVRARRALHIYYLLFIIYYLPRRGTLVPDGAPIRSVPGNCNKKTALRFP